ncbi:tetratricopeptide repeat-containing diguanylate cyclase [Rheinheimera maricola]|uniref:diguanylate cyclase n=1 Tax=Rheinheimera maricola TaxID=2793282 RepID=A0ABS7XD76_9GAMM|nr:GGDEF domain-containing protein [Rheinheimera maricola]MBZ9613486.1 diguanylate cyclase [Rheinheimera maricola]
MSTLSSISCRIFILLSLFMTTLTLQAEEVDAVLEAELDRYILLLQQDQPAGEQLLLQLEAKYSDTAAIGSRVRLLSYIIGHTLSVQDMEKQQQLMQQLLAMAQYSEHPDTLSEILASELEQLMYQNKLDDAIIKADKLQDQLSKVSSPRIRYYSNNVLGRLFMADGQYEMALQHLVSALDALAETDDALTLRRRAFLNFNIANVHTELKNWPQARQLTEAAINEALKYNHTNFLPDLYLLLGYIVSYQDQHAEAIKINQKALEFTLNNELEGFALIFENNLGASYIELEDYPAAKAVLTQAQVRAERLKDDASAQLINMNLGYIRVMEGEHDAGLAQMQENMALLSKITPKAQFEPYYEHLAKAYAKAGRYQQQADTLLEQMAMREDIRSTDREARLNELQNRYDTKAKMQQITILEQENNLKAQLLENQRLQQQLIWLVVVIAVFAAIMLLQLYRKVRRSNKKLYESNKQLAYQSQRDVLTGLYNRRALQEYLQKRALRRRDGDQATAVTGFLLLDIDFFKRINDNHGHAGGDVVLQDIAGRLQDTCRDKDLVVRWGGEEILLVLDNIDPAHVSTFVQRVLHAIGDKPVQFENQHIAVTASGGFVHLPFAGISEDKLDWEKVLQIADMALYLSKTNGRNQTCLVEGLNVSFAEVEPQLYSDLASAIRAGHVKVTTVTGPGGNVS